MGEDGLTQGLKEEIRVSDSRYGAGVAFGGFGLEWLGVARANPKAAVTGVVLSLPQYVPSFLSRRALEQHSQLLSIIIEFCYLTLSPFPRDRFFHEKNNRSYCEFEKVCTWAGGGSNQLDRSSTFTGLTH